MLIGLAPILRFKLFDELFNLLRFATGYDQNCISCCDDDNVVKSDNRGEDRVICPCQAIMAVVEYNGAHRRVAAAVVINQLPDCIPTAHV